MAYAKNFPDGLCGGPLADAVNASLVLVSDGKESVAADYVTGNSITSGYVLGGTGVISDKTVNKIFNSDRGNLEGNTLHFEPK